MGTLVMPERMLWGPSHGGYRAVVQTPPQTLPADIAEQADVDARSIARVLAGDREAFAVLVTKYSDPLYRHALNMTGSPDVAEDIMQASFIKAFSHLGEVRGRFDAWIFRIVANGCKDWLKNIRRTHVSYEEDDQPSHLTTPDEELDRSELRVDLDWALGQLSPSLREAFVMKHVEGRSYEEMAEMLDSTVGALKMRVHRAREALQALLEEKYA
jgi:RNA polymerase sigma-70 factor, ECF subfamily